MATVVAQSHYIFGLRTGVRNNLLYFDEQTIIFPCGNNCVRYNINQKCQKFIPGTERSQGMKALAISTNRRYLAVSECGEKATITVFDLQHEQNRKRKVLTGGEIPADEFVCMAFSPDSKYLIGQAGGPDWTLFLWMWEKKKLMATVKMATSGPINQVSFNPQDNTQICVSGNGVFKIFRYAGETLKQSSTFKTDTHNFLCHTWISTEKVVAGTETGQLMMFESSRLRWEINLASVQKAKSQSEKQDSNEPSSALPRVTAIVSYSSGFVCSAGPGTVCLFEKIEEEDQYKKTKDIKIPPEVFGNDSSSAEHQEISTLCISPSEETLTASTDRGQLYTIQLSIVELEKGDRAHFEYLSQSFHSSTVTGLSTCIRKPLIATCSLDRSVRIWNFETNDLEMFKEFQEESYSVALHPTGLFILVGFSDKLRFMTLLIDDIRTLKEFTVRSCRECVFSNGGHLFAAVNGNVINIYSTTTFEDVLNLKGHNEKVRAVVFSPDDSRLVSCGMDGAVYEWNTLTGTRESDSVLKTCSYTGVTISPDAKTFFAVGTDCTLKEIQDCQILREVPSGDVVCTTVAMSRSGRALFIGTSTGTVRAIKYPLPIQNAWLEYQAHAGPVTKMIITFDDQFLLTVSEDGCLFIWKIIDKEGQGLKREKELKYTEEILVTKSELEEKNKMIFDLNTKMDELQEDIKHQISLKDMAYKEKINELTEKYLQQSSSLNAEKEVLKTEKEKEKAAHVKALSDILEKHDKELQDKESTSNQRLMLEYEKYLELQLKLHNVQQECEQQLHSMEESKTRALEEMMQSYEAQLEEKMMLLKQFEDKSQQRVREFEEYIKQEEVDTDIEIHGIRMKYEQNLQEQKRANSKLKVELDIAAKSFNDLQMEIHKRNLEIEKLKQEVQKLESVIKSLENDITVLKATIRRKDGIMLDKEKSISELNKKNSTLNKGLEVMKHRFEFMVEEIAPKGNQIEVLKEQILEMEGELKEFHKTNTELELKLKELNLKLKTNHKEMHKEMKKVQDFEVLVQRFKADLHTCVECIQDPKRLKDNVRELYKCYVQPSDVVEKVAVHTDMQWENNRQREHYEKIIATMKKQINRDANMSEANNTKLMKHNGVLIKEINDLRQELGTLRTQLHIYESQTNKNTKGSANTRGTASAGRAGLVTEQSFEETEKIIQFQRREIHRLKLEILGQTPTSSTKLPPLAN
ncbi:cilia- and flagella-associated protein 57 [Pimephales promelas]|uniref:cilia- and flagella-associated protein 57 n=1 Tax=Pimephales promelas TaxID=90988 RepID=UPI0019556622|nr:cilia- and flagella-associated protein 57 [Pimephales promelas]KAG1932003.1 cilia- and flagella-associated protein [Pimephales promelas]